MEKKEIKEKNEGARSDTHVFNTFHRYTWFVVMQMQTQISIPNTIHRNFSCTFLLFS